MSRGYWSTRPPTRASRAVQLLVLHYRSASQIGTVSPAHQVVRSKERASMRSAWLPARRTGAVVAVAATVGALALSGATTAASAAAAPADPAARSTCHL